MPVGARGVSAQIRHPITGKLWTFTSATPEQLERDRTYLMQLREEYRRKMRSAEDVMLAMRRMRGTAYTVEEGARDYHARPNLAKNTRRRVESWIEVTPSDLLARDLATLDIPTIARWIETLCADPKLYQSTIYLRWRTLSAVTRYAAEQGKIDSVPWGRYRPTINAQKKGERERECCRDRNELARLLHASIEEDRLLDARGEIGQYRALIAAACFLGLRRQEIAGLNWPDLDFERFRVKIVRQGRAPTTKTRRARVTVSFAGLFEIFAVHREYLASRKLFKKDGPVFPGKESTPGKPRPFDAENESQSSANEVIEQRVLRRIVERAALPSPEKWSAHSLRDTFATLEQETYGGDLRALAERMGQRSLSSLAKYLRTTRAPLGPGFVLAPEQLGTAPSPLLLTASSRAPESTRLEGGAAGPVAQSAPGPYPASSPSTAARRTPGNLAGSAVSVNVTADVREPDSGERAIVDTIASLMEAPAESLNAERPGPVPVREAQLHASKDVPGVESTTKNEEAAGATSPSTIDEREYQREHEHRERTAPLRRRPRTVKTKS